MELSTLEERFGKPESKDFFRALEFIRNKKTIRAVELQRSLELGWATSATILDKMEGYGIVGAHQGAKPRKVLKTTFK